MEWKNGSRKDPNDHILQCFTLYNEYDLLVYQMKLEGIKKEEEKLDNICEECKKEDESVSQNLMMHGYKICDSCKISKTIFPV